MSDQPVLEDMLDGIQRATAALSPEYREEVAANMRELAGMHLRIDGDEDLAGFAAVLHLHLSGDVGPTQVYIAATLLKDWQRMALGEVILEWAKDARREASWVRYVLWANLTGLLAYVESTARQAAEADIPDDISGLEP